MNTCGCGARALGPRFPRKDSEYLIPLRKSEREDRETEGEDKGKGEINSSPYCAMTDQCGGSTGIDILTCDLRV